ncbi:MAG: hypothetical protein R3330_15310, partial [Saprospiraceae bacterium]|nr:hypothetical protein [Saprospiraceae bacterium]
KASKQIDKLLDADRQFIDAWMLLSEVRYRSGQLQSAAAAMEEAIALDSIYELRNLYVLARIYAELKEYSRSEPLFVRYLDQAELSERERFRLGTQLAQVTTRRRLMENPVTFSPLPLGPAINSEADESLPAFTVDGMHMVFTRRLRGQEDLFICRWDELDQTWRQAEPLDGINTGYNEGAHAISADGRVVAFTSCGRRNSVGSCDIYLARLQADGTWSPATNLVDINTRGWEGQPSLTADGRGMYFSSDRPGGLGKRDIWFTNQDDHGNWNPPVNLGTRINTPGNESAPFLHLNDRTMFFMSDGHPGMGDYDLFVSRLDNGEWSEPANLGFPINTEAREGALSVHPNGIDAYYTAPARVDNGQQPHFDIYKFTLDSTLRVRPVSYVYGIVKDIRTHEPLTAQIELYELDHADHVFRYTSGQDGRFTAVLPHG